MDTIREYAEGKTFESYFSQQGNSNKKLVIIGQWAMQPIIFFKALADWGIPEKNIVTMRNFKSIKRNVNLEKVMAEEKTVAIFFGPVPHSNHSAAFFSNLVPGMNIIPAKEDRLVPVIKLTTESEALRITKHSLNKGFLLLYSHLFP